MRHSIPLIGSFSSAGPFVFGPVYLWSIMLGLVIFPTFYGPWIILGICAVSTLVVLSLIGFR